MRNGRKINDENWIKSSIEFNQWNINNAIEQNIHILDTTKLLQEETAKEIDKWIMEKINIM